ncbi:MAG: hypothetical protein ABJH63_18060 [Rhizobiaceae bacterium]
MNGAPIYGAPVSLAVRRLIFAATTVVVRCGFPRDVRRLKYAAPKLKIIVSGPFGPGTRSKSLICREDVT